MQYNINHMYCIQSYIISTIRVSDLYTNNVSITGTSAFHHSHRLDPRECVPQLDYNIV